MPFTRQTVIKFPRTFKKKGVTVRDLVGTWHSLPKKRTAQAGRTNSSPHGAKAFPCVVFSPRMKVAKIKELESGTHVIFHPAEGRKQQGVIEDDIRRGVYTVRLREGSLVEATRERLEVDSDEYPSAGLFCRHSFPLQFVVMQGPEHAALVKTISDNGGEVLKSAKDHACLTINGGAPLAAPTSALADKVYRKEYIFDSVSNKTLLNKELFVHPSLGTHRPAAAAASRKPPYVPQEDDSILAFVTHKSGQGSLALQGNKLWQAAEVAQVCPGRTWSSMKERFKKFLELKYHNQVNKGRRRQAVPNVPAAGHDEETRKDEEEEEEEEVEEEAEEEEEEAAEAAAEAEAAAQNEEEEDNKRKRKAVCVAEIDNLVALHKVARAVAIHAGIVCSGDMVKAQMYLSLNAMAAAEIWHYQDDRHLIEEEHSVRTTLDRLRAAGHEGRAGMKYKTSAMLDETMADLLTTRGFDGVEARCEWIHDASKE